MKPPDFLYSDLLVEIEYSIEYYINNQEEAWECLDGAIFFSTVPLDSTGWEQVPFMQLTAYREGRLLFSGTPHTNEYVYNAEDMKYIYLDSAGL